MTIRNFTQDDFPSVAEIYRQGMATGIATFETVVPTWEIWNKKYSERCRIVAEERSIIAGFAVIIPVSSRECYAGVFEESLYVHDQWRGRGIGTQLLSTLIGRTERSGIWTLQATIFVENGPSLRLHERCGFRVVGRREKIARRNGEWKDTYLMERRSALK